MITTGNTKTQVLASERRDVCPHTGFEFACYNSCKHIDRELWDSITKDAGIYFSFAYLQAIEEGMYPEFSFRYVIFFEKGEAIGVSIYQLLQSRSELLSRFNNKNFRFFDRINLHYLINGSVFLSGSKGFYFSDKNIDRLKAMKAVSDISKNILNKEKKKHSVNVIVVKEFYTESGFNGSEVEDFKYAKFHLEPNMILQLKKTWITYDDYLGAMSKKYRSKSKYAYNKTKEIIDKKLSIEEIGEFNERIHELYESVYKKADFKLGMMSVKTFINLKRELEDDFCFRAYFLDDKMVAFSTAYKNGPIMDAGYIGLDYDYNDEFPLYHRILYDLAKEGIARKVDQINYGRTAGEIKSRLGAEPHPSISYVHLRNKIVHNVLGGFISRIKPKAFPVRNPFKEISA